MHAACYNYGVRLRHLTLPLLVLTLLACQAVSVVFPPPSLSPSPLTFVPTSAAPTPLPAASPTPLSPTPSPSPIVMPADQSSGLPGTDSSDTYSLILHPDGALYVGDTLSFEVIAPSGTELDGLKANIELSAPDMLQLGSADFGGYGIAARRQATLYWAWDTAGFESGVYTLTYTIQPVELVLTETVTLLPADLLPAAESGAQWATTDSECCLIHYVTGTAAERDLPELAALVDEQAASVSRLLNAEFDEPVDIVLLPRVMGHGGFTAQEISISYLDRNYAGGSPQIVLHHELVHVLDSRLGGELRPSLLLEGLAVYLSDGHFKPEPLLPRAAALLEMGLYIPLQELADDFYPAQHETGYLQAGALVAYMVETWGWEAFSDFYRQIAPAPDGVPPGRRQSRAIDAALREHFAIGFAELEAGFLEALRRELFAEAHRQDVRLSLKLYDLVRRYQQVFDPSAYFMTAWLPDGVQMRERGITADYLRHPDEVENIALEALLVAADGYLKEGEYARAEEHLHAVEQALSVGLGDASLLNPLAADSLALVRLLMERGYQVQRLQVEEHKARVWSTDITGTTAGQELVLFDLVRRHPGDGWSVVEQRSY